MMKLTVTEAAIVELPARSDSWPDGLPPHPPWSRAVDRWIVHVAWLALIAACGLGWVLIGVTLLVRLGLG